MVNRPEQLNMAEEYRIKKRVRHLESSAVSHTLAFQMTPVLLMYTLAILTTVGGPSYPFSARFSRTVGVE